MSSSRIAKMRPLRRRAVERDLAKQSHRTTDRGLLKRADKKIPDWIVAGSGRVVAAGGGQPALAAVPWPALYRLVGSLEKSDDLVSDGTFSAAAIADVGEATVAFLIDKRGKTLFAALRAADRQRRDPVRRVSRRLRHRPADVRGRVFGKSRPSRSYRRKVDRERSRASWTT